MYTAECCQGSLILGQVFIGTNSNFLVLIGTGCPKKNSPLACCNSGANGLFFLGHPVAQEYIILYPIITKKTYRVSTFAPTRTGQRVPVLASSSQTNISLKSPDLITTFTFTGQWIEFV